MLFRRSLLLSLVLLFPVLTFASNNCTSDVGQSAGSDAMQQANPAGVRTLTVVLYPFVPNFGAFRDEVTKRFHATHPDIRLAVVDLTDNYYGTFTPAYVGCVKADVYEVDSVFLHDFAINKKIQPLPEAAKLPSDGFLKNAMAGSIVDGVQFGSPHWVCGNFLFFASADKKMDGLGTITRLMAAVGPHPGAGGGLSVDLMGKSTLGEFYLNAAVDHFKDWNEVAAHAGAFDKTLEKDLVSIRDLCEQKTCRDEDKHQTSFFAQQFGGKHARALIGYSESLNGALELAADRSKCLTAGSCLNDADIDVEELPLDSHASKAMSWVDSFVIDKKCEQQCLTDATEFIRFMNDDDVYMSILLPQDGVPAYLLPAKASLYSRQDLLSHAHLYPKLRSIIESSEVPSDLGLNEQLRNIGRRVDKDLSKP
jgi:thiamine pyridinylase